jgi:PAP2 superfamily
MRSTVLQIFFTLFFGFVSSPLFAQEMPSTPAAQVPVAQSPIPGVTQGIPQIDLPKTPNFAAQFMRDQAGLWKSGLGVKRNDLKWLLPVGAGAAALFATDSSIVDFARRDEGIRPASTFISRFGSTPVMGGTSVSMWALGKFSHNDRLADTGQLSTEAILHTQIVVQGLKLLSSRTRPNGANNHSFPSGHAATTFAFATVVAHEYHDRPLIAVGAYGLATAVSLSRVGGLNHFPSDVLVGAVIGELVGRYIIHRHAAQE